jgi:phosphohistidine phosphatase
MQTWELVAAAMAPDAPPPRSEIRRPLYQARPGDLLETVQRVGEEVKSLMLVGHNPGIGRLALRLAGEGDEAQLAQIAKKFPTAALAVISFDDQSWAEAGFGAGRLVDFVTPKDLA